MSRNGTGTYNLPAGNPVVTGTVIASTWANSTLTDIASALTGSVAADGQTPMVGDLDMNTNKIVNLEPGTVAGNAIEYDQFVAATTTAVNITGGTINGTTIGATTPSTGAFTNLSASGTLTVTGVATFAANSQFNGTGALKVPVGTTGQQPTPATGMLRFNTTSTKFEGYNGTAWGSIAAPAGSNTQIQYNDSGIFGASSALTFNGTILAATAVTTDTLKTTTGVLATQNGMTGIAKAWVNYNASTQTIRASFNVSSVTYNTTGDYTVNFTTAMPNANYATNASLGPSAGTVADTAIITSYTASGVRINTYYLSGTDRYSHSYATNNVSVFSA